MADVNKTVQVTVTANVRQAGQALQSFAKNSKGSIDSIAKSAKSAGKALTAFGAVAAAGLGLAIKTTADFEKRMADISTLISGDSTEAVAVFEDGIKDLLKTVPKSADELGASAYAIVSAGITDAADSMIVLESSAKLAVAGLGTTEEATDLVTSAINAFGLDAGKADEVADILFKTVKNGKTTVSELAQAFGASAPVIASAGISLADFSAATAALTTTGLPASQAQNGLRAAIISLQKPTKEMQDLFTTLGVKNMKDLIGSSENLQEVFGRLREATQGNDEQFAKALGSVEALGAAIGLTDTVSEAYRDTINNMTIEGEALDEAFKKQTETFAAQFQLIKNSVTVAFLEFGEVALPIVKEAVEVLSGALEGLTDWFSNLDEEQKETLVTIALATTAFAAIGGPILLLSATLIPALVSVVGVLGVALTFLAANPIILIVAAITGMIVLIGKFIGTWKMLSDSTLTTWNKITGIISSAVNSITSKINSMIKLINSIPGVDVPLIPQIDTSQIETALALSRAQVSPETGFTPSEAARFANFPGRQGGGPVQRGRAFMVGEGGPELFVPNQSGQIVPSGQSGPQVSVNFGNVTINNASDEEAFFQMFEQRLIRTLKLNTLGSI